MHTRNTTFFWLLFALALGANLIAWLVFNTEAKGDELRYLEQAHRMLSGDTLYKNDLIPNSPAYPALLASMLKIGVPEFLLNISSVAFSVLATLLMYAVLGRFCTNAWAFGISCAFLLHPVQLSLGSQLMTEPLAGLLAITAAWLLLRAKTEIRLGWPVVFVLAAVFALLALLKPIFGYALAFMIPVSVLLAIIIKSSSRQFLFKGALTAILALVLCAPYFAFTYDKTGRHFNWGTTGGEHLYYMAIGGEDIWGSWVPSLEVDNFNFLREHGYADEVKEAAAMSGVEADKYYSALAFERVAQDPGPFFRNVVANTGRVLFNYPYSFRQQSLYTYGYILPNMMLFLAFILSLAMLPITRRQQHVGLLWLVGLSVVYLGGNTLMANTGRQSMVVIGPVMIWLVYQFRILLNMGIVSPRSRELGGEVLNA